MANDGARQAALSRNGYRPEWGFLEGIDSLRGDFYQMLGTYRATHTSDTRHPAFLALFTKRTVR